MGNNVARLRFMLVHMSEYSFGEAGGSSCFGIKHNVHAHSADISFCISTGIWVNIAE